MTRVSICFYCGIFDLPELEKCRQCCGGLDDFIKEDDLRLELRRMKAQKSKRFHEYIEGFVKAATKLEEFVKTGKSDYSENFMRKK